MNRYRLVIEQGALTELEALHEYVTRTASQDKADRFVAHILSDCEDLCLAPMRGMSRPELGVGTRLIGIAKGRISITFHVRGDTVTIASIYYAGRKR